MLINKARPSSLNSSALLQGIMIDGICIRMYGVRVSISGFQSSKVPTVKRTLCLLRIRPPALSKHTDVHKQPARRMLKLFKSQSPVMPPTGLLV